MAVTNDSQVVENGDGAREPDQAQTEIGRRNLSVDRENRHEQRNLKGRVSIACTICRAQHLRCDAALPTCSRCRSLNKKCIYTNIRRSRRKQVNQEEAMIMDSGSTEEVIEETLFNNNAPTLAETYDVEFSYPIAMESLQQNAPGISNAVTSAAIDGFYSYFFKGHPFVLPKPHLICQFDRDSTSVANLIPIMTLIGSLYIHNGRSETCRKDVEQAIQKQLPSDGFTVQALMLFALTLEWSDESERATSVLQRAKAIASIIRLSSRSFASEHGQGNPALEESWRRTWWELYVVDGLFAGIRHWPAFSLWTEGVEVDLPKEEDSYTESVFLSPQTLRDYDNRGFEDVEVSFSSYTYLIDAIRILGTVLGAGDIVSGSALSLVKNAEANIMSWYLHLPQSKRDPVRADGTVDEVLFRAHMVINTAATHLHRPRSMLHYSTMELLCSKYAPPLPAEVLSPEENHHDRHTHKAIHAAKTFVDLLTVPTSPITHSPFVMCMGSMAMATHMSGCEYLLRGPEYLYARDRVRMFLGILKAFKSIWPQASKWSSEISLMAKAVFESRDVNGELMVSTEYGTTDGSLGLILADAVSDAN
ncbi:C6 zinc finger domain-containing protein [Dactylonectria estremocensis]|uniref:C6 zinc finger domain-containing protein n=1 Tax=Dactylonectria estremocensis TaxID=1079267 RepID=A0A9P9E2N5_9HYPO|nr:C6 zinc finger domain-containing protein [Dactylonectria estremocensis]